jgi:hypothetical protein
MDDNLQLFRVEVTRTWTATMEAFAWAYDRDGAMNAAMDEEDLTSFDAWDDGAKAVAFPADIRLLEQLPSEPDELLLVPESQRPGSFKQTWRVVDTVAEFVSFLGSEDGERLRIAAIERNNGQLSFLETNK